MSAARKRSFSLRRLRVLDLPRLRNAFGARGRTRHWLAPFGLAALIVVGSACTTPPPPPVSITGVAYAGPPSLNLRKDLGPRASVVATAKHGDRLDVLETRRRFVRVRTAAGIEGW